MNLKDLILWCPWLWHICDTQDTAPSSCSTEYGPGSGVGKAAVTLSEAIPQTRSCSAYLSASCDRETALWDEANGPEPPPQLQSTPQPVSRDGVSSTRMLLVTPLIRACSKEQRFMVCTNPTLAIFPT